MQSLAEIDQSHWFAPMIDHTQNCFGSIRHGGQHLVSKLHHLLHLGHIHSEVLASGDKLDDLQFISSYIKQDIRLIICCRKCMTNFLAVSEPGFTSFTQRFISSNLLAKLGSIADASFMSDFS